MSTPLATGYRETPLWTDEHPLADREPPPLPSRADVVVVGGGYCGLAAATELASRGLEAIVVDREAQSRGASSRTGGTTREASGTSSVSTAAPDPTDASGSGAPGT